MEKGTTMSDYINRDTLIDYLLKLIDVERKQGSDVINYGQERINQTDAILAYVENMPHADVVEAKHGKWEHNPNGIDRDFIWWKCSECGHVIYSETEQDRKEFHAYCGRCGARMDKVTDDE